VMHCIQKSYKDKPASKRNLELLCKF